MYKNVTNLVVCFPQFQPSFHISNTSTGKQDFELVPSYRSKSQHRTFFQKKHQITLAHVQTLIHGNIRCKSTVL
jgi:hypothetical protein